MARSKARLSHCLSLSLTVSHCLSYSLSYSLSFFWTQNEGPRAGSRQRHHSFAVRITVIIYTAWTKLNEDREKGDISSWPTVVQDTKQWTNATDILHSVQTKSKLILCVSSSLGTQRDFHVSALCVEDPSPPSTPTSPYLTTHQILFTLGHHHKPNPRTHQLLLHVDNVNPSRASGSFSIQGLFRQRAYPVLKGGNFSITLHRFLLFRSVTQTIEATKSSEARAILAIGVTEAIEAIGAIGAIGATIKAIDAIAVISAIEVTLSSGALYAFRVNCFSKTAKSWNNCYRRHFGIQFSESRRHF